MSESIYLTDVIILLVTAVVAVPLFQYLRLGMVPGFLAGGAVVGPWGLGLINQVEEIRHLAEFGVIFLLFVIGIELKPSRLWIMRKSVFGLGTAQVLVTGIVITWLAMAFGLPKHTALVVGFGLALSSTAFALQILTEKGELSSAYGRSSFAILLLQDLAVVPLIALVPLLANKELTLTQDIELAAAETFIILMSVLLLTRLILNPLFNIVASIRSPEVFMAMAVLVVLGTAWITNWAGLSMGLGAFLAGMLLSDSSYRHQIMADIQPFRGMLLGLFFMTVGMSIDFGLLAEQGVQISVLVGGLLLIKALIIWGLCRVTGRSHGESTHVALLLPQSGEFAFVLFGLALGLGIMTIEIYQLLVLVVVMTMVITPMLFKAAHFLGQIPVESPQQAAPTSSQIPTSNNHVIIAGFGRFGQQIVRVLEKAKITYRALDINPTRVTEGHARGNAVYYGDVSRMNVLHSAGVANAALIIFAVDKMETIAQVTSTLNTSFPKLPVYARVSDPGVGQKLHNMGVDHTYPETLESSLQITQEVLYALDIDVKTVDGLISGARLQENNKLTKFIPETQHKQFNNILLLLNSKTDISKALEHITVLMYENKTHLKIIELITELPVDIEEVNQNWSSENIHNDVQKQHQQRLDKLVASLREVIEVETMVYLDKTEIDIMPEILSGDHDLLIKEVSPYSGIRNRYFYNIDIQLLRKCQCSIWFIKPQPVTSYRQILAAVNVDYELATSQHQENLLNQQVLQLASSLTQLQLAELHIVHIWQVYGEDVLRSGRSPFPQSDTDAYIKRELKRHQHALDQLLRNSVANDVMDSINSNVHVIHGDPRIDITRVVQNKNVDLLIIGSKKRAAIHHFILGNTAEAIFHHLNCSVLVVKLPD